MASYATVAGNATSGVGAPGGVLQLQALVVTDGKTTLVYGDTTLADELREDVDWGTGAETDILRFGLTGLSYFTIDGPHTFVCDAATAGPVLARTYNLG
jgi:hypothetical protein